MTPADIAKVDRLAGTVCHDERMKTWVDEILEAIAPMLVDGLDYEGLIHLRRRVRAEMRSIVEAAFSHPEILGVARTLKRRKPRGRPS